MIWFPGRGVRWSRRLASGNAVGGHAVKIAAPLFALTGLVATWWVLVAVNNIPSYVVPTPPEVWNALTAQGWGFAPDVWITLQEVLIGFGVGLIGGVGLASTMSLWSPLRVGLYPLLIFSQVVPIFVVSVVVTVVWANDGLLPQIVVTALYSFLPLVVTGTVGLDQVDADLVRLLRAAGASRVRIFMIVRFPAALPSFFGGAKLAMVFAVAAAAFSEWIGGYGGLGYYMRSQNGFFHVPQVFAGAIVLTALGGVLFGCVSFAEYVAIPWNRSNSSQSGGVQ